MMKLICIVILILIYTNSSSQTWPVGNSAGTISSTFGARKLTNYDFHAGIDLPAPKPTQVLAVKDGIVDDRGDEDTNQEWLSVKNDDGSYTYYIHIEGNESLTDGQDVYEGVTQIGTVTDYKPNDPGTSGDHLHLELREFPDRISSYHPFSTLPYTNLSNTITITDEVLSDTDGNYVEIKIESIVGDLDVDFLEIRANGTGYDGNEYTQDFIFEETYVDFWNKINCWDEQNNEGRKILDSQGRVMDDGTCHLRIVTQDFNGEDPQVIKYRFYFHDDFLSGGIFDLAEFKVSANFIDASLNSYTTPEIDLLNPIPNTAGDVTFYPPPGNYYDGTKVIEMTNNTSNSSLEIRFNTNLNTSYVNAEIETPDLSTDNMQYIYGNGYDTHARKVYPGIYWYYFKARLYNPTDNVFVGEQSEGAYKTETNPSSKISGSANNSTFKKYKDGKQIFQSGDIYNEN